ncbi:RNA methyltransferase [Niveibacterium sp. SC-1]|uniref:TrmH family RNA methyltransferase n=1 Tax=Niveibacterium sp. SC-1 TaxID=3135646 RepID=UPI00311D5B7D
MQEISSRDNARYKHLRHLVESARERRVSGQALLDGVHLVDAALHAGLALRELWFSSSRQTQPEHQKLARRASPAPCFVLPEALFKQLSPVETPSGVLALIDVPPVSGRPDPGADWLLLDGVQDAGNVGTLMRTAAAAGVTEVLLSAQCAQVWSPKVLRAAMGAHFHLRLHEHCDLSAALASYSGQVAVTRLDAARSLFELDLRTPVAWIFGAEGQGVSEPLRQRADLGVLVPMAAGVESLNVAACAAVCLFEQRRQRLRAN